uniref:Uncharacterized protein n=1 Tax=Arundo donax TaxID=35708 RepID=A0A0A9BIT4_ARUDO
MVGRSRSGSARGWLAAGASADERRLRRWRELARTDGRRRRSSQADGRRQRELTGGRRRELRWEDGHGDGRARRFSSAGSILCARRESRRVQWAP